MKKLFLILPLLALAACGQSREQLDQKLAGACLSGVKSLYTEGQHSFDVKSKTFSSEKSHENTNLRVVRLHVYYTRDGGAVEGKDYACAFEEISGLFGYAPKFYYLDNAGEKYGNVDGVVQGGLENLLKITQAMGLSYQ